MEKQKQYPKTEIQRRFAPLKRAGLHIMLSLTAQNVVEFEVSTKQKIELYERIRRYQPQFLEQVGAIVGW